MQPQNQSLCDKPQKPYDKLSCFLVRFRTYDSLRDKGRDFANVRAVEIPWMKKLKFAL